jgi:2-keto-4-pentenoate hydratase
METETPAASPDRIEAAARRLLDAERSGVPCAPVRDLIIGTDDAYAVQEHLTRIRLAEGRRLVGRKIGLTSPAVQQQLGVGTPDFGMLYADMAVPDGAEIPVGAVLQARAEAEVALVLQDDLTHERHTVADIIRATAFALPAIEVCGSRIRDWDITIADTVADNASSGLFVLAERRLTLDEFEPRETSMRMYADDVLVSEGSGAACLGDPLNALAWLARTAREFGEPLRAGQVVLSGALGPMVPAPPGTRIRAEITSLGEVTAAFSEKRDA